ncbi:hypothetical protein PRZ48_012033 [Zasmidium cellare]|uniref:Uncharacterized protein n=1 Tax=Zasmidium cellare TaxID=395010 RepID=A0ABR0E824_ZASCE|nr:hypothetical protein PRZ48_012033 [Zasmidium cellare]
MAPTKWPAAADVQFPPALEQILTVTPLQDEIGIAKRFFHDYAHLVYAASCISNAAAIWPNTVEKAGEMVKWIEKANNSWAQVSSELNLELNRMTQSVMNQWQAEIHMYSLRISGCHSEVYAFVESYMKFSIIEPVLAQNAKYWGLFEEDGADTAGSAELAKATKNLWSALQDPTPAAAETRSPALDPVREQERMLRAYGIRARMVSDKASHLLPRALLTPVQARALQPLLLQYHQNGFGVADDAVLEALRPAVQQYKNDVALLATSGEYAGSAASKGRLRISGAHVDLELPANVGVLAIRLTHM